MDVTATQNSFLPTSADASYQCTFTNSWTADNHPIMFPTGNAHWSPFVLAAHNTDYEMWAPGAMASAGVEDVAEVRCRIGDGFS